MLSESATFSVFFRKRFFSSISATTCFNWSFSCRSSVTSLDVGSNVKIVFRDFQLRENDRFVVRAGGTVGRWRRSKGLWESAWFADFHRNGSFHSRVAG